MFAKRLRTLVTASALVSAAAGLALDAQTRRTPPLVRHSPIERIVGHIEPLQAPSECAGPIGRTAVPDVLRHLHWSERAR